MKKRDLSGSSFGAVDVLERIDGPGHLRYKCRCSACGREFTLDARCLDGRTLADCGCSREIAPWKQFGGVIALAHTSTEPDAWLIRCTACGREREMRASSIRRCPASCGCKPIPAETYQANGEKAIPVNVQNGIQVFVATKEGPNKGNRHGYRFVRVIRRKNGNPWYYATFKVRGERYYRGGFESLATAHDWAEAEHAEALAKWGITDPRREKGKQDAEI